MSEGSLELKEVGLERSGRALLKEVDLQLHSGEVLGLVGPNGAGKTSLLRVATGVLEPDWGEVHVKGEALGSWDRKALARTLAVVPQETSVPFPFRCLEVVLMGRSPHLSGMGFESSRDEEVARQAMERLGILDLAERSILSLSGGERQLVMLARALTQDPEFLLLDEPTANLDLKHRLDVMSLVAHLAEQGRGILMVSHDLEMVARCCQRLVLLSGGVVVAQGETRSVLTPENLQACFGVEAEILSSSDGALAVIPRC